MPLAFRTIQPLWLGRRSLNEDEKEEEVVPVAVCHNACLGAMVQLASLVRHADDLFCDLAEECQRIFDKTESISCKVQNIERIITQLDSTEVKIPVGTLKQFRELADHHVAKHGFDCDHFTPANRPYCIRFNYSMCELTPVHALKGVDPFRKDGLSSSHLFKLWPIALKDMQLHADDMNIPRRYSSPLAQKKRYKALKLKERRRTIHSVDEIFHAETSADIQAGREGSLSKSQPSIMVAVDTSGSGFERMAMFRQSLSGDDSIRSRDKRRRRTVSGVPENIMQEIEQFEHGRRISRDSPRKYSLDDLDQKELDARDEIMQQYLTEIDSAIAEREEEEYAERREAKLFKFIPCRRSRSLPRCVKLITSRGHDELTLSSVFSKKAQQKFSADEPRLKQTADGLVLQDKFSYNTSFASLSGEDNKSSRRSSLIGNKIKALVSGTLRPRPKSLDFDSIEVKDESIKQILDKSQGRSSSLSRVSSPSMPEGVMTRTTSSESQVGPGSYYYFDSNTLPRAQAKKYDFPWDSLPKDWTTSVKLREISKRRKEDRQSSSGNWSQSGYSSNRQSLDSDAKSSKPSSSLSQCSLGKDSGRDSPRSTGDRDGLDVGYMGDAASTESISDTKSMSNTDSEDWIRSLAEQAANRGDVTCTSADALANLSRLTKQNIRNLDILVPGRTCFRQKRNELEDDGESSVYSIDQEGFYTSFHSDSGLKRSTNNLVEVEDDDLMIPRIRESKSLQSMTSSSTLKSAIFRSNGDDFPGSPSSISTPNLAPFSNILLPDIHESDSPDIDFPEFDDGEVEYGDYGTLKAKKKTKTKKKLPPLPPPRTTSITGNCNNTPNASDEGLNNLDDSPSSIETSSESSDHETIYARLKMKTSISAHTFPSWCVGIASDEDDFQERLNAESSEVEELFSGKDNWLSGTLPRISLTSGTKASNEIDQTTNSWPRVKRLNPQQPGILKTQDKDKARPIPGNTKVLNFDPIVNLFDASSPHGVQMPLSRLSSSDESSSPGTSTFETHPLSYKLSQSSSLSNQENKPAVAGQELLSHKEISSKYQSSITTKRGASRPWSMVVDLKELTTSSTPAKGHSGLYSGKANYNTRDLSVVLSGSNPSIDFTDSFDAPLTAYDKSNNTFTSNSTIALSDIDSSSLTHVTMSDSSPSGSSLSLNWDTDNTPNPTPMATPVRKHAPLSLPSSTTDRSSSAVRGAVQIVTNNTNNAQQLNEPLSSDQTSASTLSSSSSNQVKEHGVFQHKRPSFSNAGSVQLESGHVPTSAQLPSRSSIICNTSTQQSNVSASTALGHANDNDGNNNRNKATNIKMSDSEILSSDSLKQNITYQNDFHANDISLHSSLAQSHISTNAPMSVQDYHLQQMKTAYKSSHDDRRRSAPTTIQAKNSSSSSSISGNEDSSGCRSSSSSSSVKRRQSDNNLYSPADSGYGSPSVSSQPSMTVQTFSYSPSQNDQQYLSVVQSQVISSTVSCNPSLTTPLPKETKSAMSDLVTKSTSANVSSIVRSDYPMKISRQNSNQSNESINSQFSVSSTKQLISKMQKTDLSQPVLHRESSSESVHSNGSGGRSDSYRVAMLLDNDETSLIPNVMPNVTSSSLPKNNPQIYHSNRSKSIQVPVTAAYTDDVVGRADSYRCAVRNTQSLLLSDAFGRNTSYRLATCEEDVVITNSRMDACNLWTGKTGASRDVRRMGITDIDQLKQYGSEPDSNEKSTAKYNMAKISNTPHAKKKLSAKAETEGQLNLNKPSSNEHKRFMRSSSKDKAKQKTQSSTYIRFDPIFESGEDLRASNESLRPPSIVSIRTLAMADSNETLTSENTQLIKQRVSSTSPSRRRSGSHGRKDDKSSLSIFGSIKTTIKSIGGTKGE